MRLVCISDTHGKHRFLGAPPPGDVLIHAGDSLREGTIEDLADVNAWLKEQKFDHKIVIAGNHDRVFAESRVIAEGVLSAATYLQDSSVTVEGVKFWGTPWTPDFFPEHWVFNQPRNSIEARERFRRIPKDVDVLISHGPPYGILDQCPDINDLTKVVNVGCEVLAEELTRIEPQYHVFGHIHESHGSVKSGRTEYFNVASLTGRYSIRKGPYTVIDV